MWLSISGVKSGSPNKSGHTPEMLSEQILNCQVSYGWRHPNPGKQSRFPPQISFRTVISASLAEVLPVKISPQTVPGNRHGNCREMSGETLLFLFPQEMQLKSAQNFSRQISRHFSTDTLQLQMPAFTAFFALQMFALENCHRLAISNRTIRIARPKVRIADKALLFLYI